MSDTRLIRKYVNRRLYDTAQSRYVNLRDVRDFVAQGGCVRVVEQATGADITTPILLQIIADNDRGRPSLLSGEFLSGMIRLDSTGAEPEVLERLSQMLSSAVLPASKGSEALVG